MAGRNTSLGKVDALARHRTRGRARSGWERLGVGEDSRFADDAAAIAAWKAGRRKNARRWPKMKHGGVIFFDSFYLAGRWREQQAWVFQTSTREEKLSKKGGARFSKQTSPKGCPIRDLLDFEGHPEGFLALGRVARLGFGGIAAIPPVKTKLSQKTSPGTHVE